MLKKLLATKLLRGIVDGWGKLRHLIDFTKIDNTLTTEQWESLSHLTKKYKVYKAFMLGCYLCEQLFDYAFVNKTNHQGVAKKLGEKIIVKIKADQLSGKWSQQPVKLIYYLMMRDNWLDFFKSLRHFISYAFREILFKVKR